MERTRNAANTPPRRVWSYEHGFWMRREYWPAAALITIACCICLLLDANPAQLSSNCIDCVGEAAVYKNETAASTRSGKPCKTQVQFLPACFPSPSFFTDYRPRTFAELSRSYLFNPLTFETPASSIIGALDSTSGFDEHPRQPQQPNTPLWTISLHS